MKTPLLKLSLFAALAGLPAMAAESIAPVGGTYTYSQTFDTMFAPATAGSVATAAATAWTDGVTVPNWWFYYTSNAAATSTGVFAGTAYAHTGNDGSAAPVLSLVSQGTAASTDRTFATPSTTVRCEQSGIVVFQNNSAKAVDLSRIQFKGEVRRTNSTANVSETVIPYFRIADSQAAALTMTTANLTAAQALAAFPNDGTPTAGYFLTGWTAIPGATFTYSNALAATQVDVSVPVDAPGLTGIRLASGKFLAVRFSNINNAGTDSLLGIDDLVMNFNEVDAAVLAATVTGVVRDDNTTPLDPADDKMNFTLNVFGSGPVNPNGWEILTPADFVRTGAYGVDTNFSVPIAAFAAAPHMVTVTVQNQGDPGAATTFSVTAPWCAITASANSFAYNEGATPDDAADDSVTFLASATGTYTGTSYSITAPAQTLPYGSAASLTAGPGTTQTYTFTDSADPACTAALVVGTPAIIGLNNLSGSPVNLKSAPAFVTRSWAFNGTARTATQVSGTQADHVILSEVINLSTIGGVVVTAELDAIAGTDTVANNTSGFEAADHFRIDLIIDGGAPVSILGAADTDADGILEGAAAGAGTELPDAGQAPVNTPKVVKNFPFSATVPPGANSLQIRIVGNSNSGNETFLFKNLKLDAAPPSLLATAAAGVLNNQGTVTATDDTVQAAVTIIADNLGASPGWNSDLIAPDGPVSGSYSTGNPVTFTVAAASAPKTVNFVDQLDLTKTATVIITAPRTLTAVPAAIVRNINSTADVSDDSVSFNLTVTGANGGPQFTIAGEPGIPLAANNNISAAGNTVAVTVSPVPAIGGTIYVRVVDASYPGTAVNVAVAVPAPATLPAQYIIGRQNLGAGILDVVSFPGDPLLPAWQNFPALRALAMHNGAALTTVRSEIINLSAIGAVTFSGRLRGVDTSSGFEDADTFAANLIIDGDTVNFVRTTDAADQDAVKNGLEGIEIAVAGGSLANPVVNSHNLSALIPAGANTVQLEITGINNSVNEQMILDDILFAIAPVTGDSDGDGVSDIDEGIMGTDPNNTSDVLRLTRNAANQNQIDFPAVASRFYRVYQSDDTNGAEATHLAVWKDAGPPAIAGNAGSFSITVTPGEPRRFYRLHVMTTDGPNNDGVWPATVP